MTKTIRSFISDESGTTAVEYSLIAALLSIAAIASMHALGSSVDALFNKVSTVLMVAAAP